MTDNTVWEYGRGLKYLNEDLAQQPLESELVQFIENNSNAFGDTDTDTTQSTKMKRYIIRYFALVDSPGCGHHSYHPNGRPGLVNIARKILTVVADESFKKGEIVRSNQIILCLSHFAVCVELIDKFLDRFIATEYNSAAKPYMLMIKQSVLPSYLPYPNIHQLCQQKINKYHLQVLNLWAEVLIRERKIPEDMLAETQRIVTTKEQFKTQYSRLLDENANSHVFNLNLPELVLLKYLTLLFVVNKIPSINRVLLEPVVTGRNLQSTVDCVVYGLVSQFVEVNNPHNFQGIPHSDKHNSELNELMLVCTILMQDTSRIPPARAYLSSEVLDDCVTSLSGRFPTEQEFIQFLNTRRIEKASSRPGPAPSAPPFHDLGGGKKTKRNHKKKYKINKRKSIKK